MVVWFDLPYKVDTYHTANSKTRQGDKPRWCRRVLAPGQVWNPSQWNDPAFSKKVDQMHEERDEPNRQALARDMIREIVDKAPYPRLPTQYL
jgi:ABC-type transport system substrate-binding protein